MTATTLAAAVEAPTGAPVGTSPSSIRRFRIAFVPCTPREGVKESSDTEAKLAGLRNTNNAMPMRVDYQWTVNIELPKG